MKVIIFGATGSVGKHVVEQSLEQGHQVTAFARSPDKVAASHSNLQTYKGDAFNYEQVADAIKGHDAVIIVLGSSKLTGTIRSDGTRNIVKAMEQNGIKRLICQSTMGVGDSNEQLNFYWRHIMFGFILKAVFKDHVLQEQIVKNSQLDWTIVRPAGFTDEAPKNSYRHGSQIVKSELTYKIPRADVAHFILQELKEGQYQYQTPSVSY